MIRVALFDGKPGVKYADFESVSLGEDGKCRTTPPGLLDSEAAEQIARELSEGRVSGWVGQMRWYYRAGKR